MMRSMSYSRYRSIPMPMLTGRAASLARSPAAPRAAARTSGTAAAPPQAPLQLLPTVAVSRLQGQYLVPGELQADDQDRGDDRGDQPARRVGQPPGQMAAAGQSAARFRWTS